MISPVWFSVFTWGYCAFLYNNVAAIEEVGDI